MSLSADNILVWLSNSSNNVTKDNFQTVVQYLSTNIQNTEKSRNDFFVLIMAIVVYFMQCGYAFLEAGSLHSKNAANSLLQKFLNSFLAAICYYVFGYAFAYGKTSNPFCGYSYWAMYNLGDDGLFSNWFFQYVIAALPSSIISGAIAERCSLLAYLICTFFMTAFIYPVVTHWAWHPVGWMSQGGSLLVGNTVFMANYQDFSGSGVVHVVGGIAAFVGAAVIGPRAGRLHSETKNTPKLKKHSAPLILLGGLILIFGFFAFNAGALAHMNQDDDGNNLGRIMVNTILSGSMGAFIVMIKDFLIKNKSTNTLETVNGCLSGLVAVCAGCNVFMPYSAIVVGTFAGISYMLWSKIMSCCRIDDPLNAVAVHFGGGIWGVIVVAFLHKDKGIVYQWSVQSGLNLGWQLAGLSAIIAWVGILTGVLFGILKQSGILRVSEETEKNGLDNFNEDEKAYSYEQIYTDNISISNLTDFELKDKRKFTYFYGNTGTQSAPPTTTTSQHLRVGQINYGREAF